MRDRLVLVVLAASILVGGCALTEDTVRLSYQPRTAARPFNAAQDVTVAVVVRDARREKERDRVSCKKNAYGVEMAAIRSENDVPALVQSSIQTELTRRGFRSGPGGVTVVVEVRRLYNDFKSGFFSGDADAEADLEVTVLAPGQTDQASPLFEGRAEGSGQRPNIQLSSGENAKGALEDALSEAIWRLFNNRRFIGALLVSRAPPPPAPQPDVSPPPIPQS